MANDLSVGDVVQLNSGGPLMTVYGFVSLSGDVSCVWFQDGGTEGRSNFPPNSVKIRRSGLSHLEGEPVAIRGPITYL